MKAATMICQQIFSILALVIFLLKILLKSASKSFFFALASRSGFGATISNAVVRSLCKNPFKKCFKIVFFFALASRSGFGATISDAVARSSIVFCNSVSADPIAMAASKLLRAVAAFVILLSFAAGSRKSSWSGCRKAAK